MKKTDIWFDHFAEQWNEALPLGNGRMGGMLYGRIWDEVLHLNEETVDYDGRRERINPDARKNFPLIQRLTMEGNMEAAEKLTVSALTSVPESMSDYQPFGKLSFRTTNRWGDIKDYRRWLSLQEGICHVRYTMGEATDEREVFFSYPDDVAVYHMECKTQPLDMRMKLHRDHNYPFSEKIDACTTAMYFFSGEQKNVGMVRACVTGENAQCVVRGEYLCVDNAKTVTVYLATATSYRSEDPRSACIAVLDRAVQTGYPALRRRHIDDYQSLYCRMSLSLTPEDTVNDIPTDRRVHAMRDAENKAADENGCDASAKGTDLILTEQLFAFSRYLTISASRPGTLPMNLQGIWNDQYQPGWGSRYTININTQMNYWPSEPSNLSECHTVLLDHLYRMLPRGQKCAREMYGCRGFVCHHNTDIHGDCAPQDEWIPGSYWVLGGAWLCNHLWMHYEYSLDRAFLDKAYPIMHEAALFFLDFLVENKDGYLIICPSVSPENTYFDENHNYATFSPGTAMDTEILHDLFRAVIQTCDILGLDADFAAQVKACDARLLPCQISADGTIVEWDRAYEEESPGHRHISHLYGLYPSDQFTPRTPDFFRAAQATLVRRLQYGGGSTGWSRAWVICFWARLLDGNRALENLNHFLIHSTDDNLFCSFPVFQIDGNFGVAAGMLEMLMQSHLPGDPVVLPALPDAWKQYGRVHGMCARGGRIVDFAWENGRLTEQTVR